jgi:hypothetical protein
MRLKRHKICVGDFDLLTIIGRGAFGEVEIHIFPSDSHFTSFFHYTFFGEIV